jgi:hypothetical protein
MTIVAPHIRKPLSADALLRLVHSGFASPPAHRLDDTAMTVSAALMSALAMFALKAPSLLAFDKERTEGTLHPIDGIERAPRDTPRRDILAPVSPTVLRPVCQSVFRPLPRGKALEAMTCLEGHSWLALDGTGLWPPRRGTVPRVCTRSTTGR